MRSEDRNCISIKTEEGSGGELLYFYDCFNSVALSTAALTAFIIAPLKPSVSKAKIPAMVVPAGEATAFLTYNQSYCD